MDQECSPIEYLHAGPDWTAKITPLALPILLWAAKKGLRITYKQLANELYLRHGEDIKGNLRLYGRPAGRIGTSLNMLCDEWGEDIPPINAIVVNAQSKLPGDGANYYIKRFLKNKSKQFNAKMNNMGLAEEVMNAVWNYTEWDKVARYYGIKRLQPVSVLLENKAENAPIDLPPMLKQQGGYPESKQHQTLKKWAVNNPKFFFHFGNFSKGENEVKLRSGDSLDAYLENNDTRLAIEVKASNAAASEVFRGIFQCVKYRATLRAMQLADSEPTNAQAVLLITFKPPSEALRLAKRLGLKIMIAPTESEIG